MAKILRLVFLPIILLSQLSFILIFFIWSEVTTFPFNLNYVLSILFFFRFELLAIHVDFFIVDKDV
jgi:hypothetical protein